MNSSFQEDLLNIDELQITHSYGTFWPRFWALLLDALILAVLAPLIIYNKTEWKSSLLFVAVSCIQIAYKPFFEYVYGATPGKMALKLKVVNYEYGIASLGEILLRNIFQIAGGLITLAAGLYAFYKPDSLQEPTFQNASLLNGTTIMAGLMRGALFIIYLIDLGFLLNSAESRSLHDRIGRTFVIKEQ